jgi:hypothetical protein
LALLNHLTLPVMRIVLFLLTSTLLYRRVVEPAPATVAGAKKKAASCAAFPFRRQARPASRR